ncbi:hypothetical protein [Halomicrobium salinisoli]|uniref:hypothetical protein n=1 Tax=Halomicrobium salinisoli TaxID=2878391 RepID=UPI001CF0C13C|nr:hypothetical protein [Halomicrobium salinisoli]
MENHRDTIFSAFALLIALLVLTGVLLILAFVGIVSYQFVSAASTIVLVAVTTYYAWQSRQSAQHTKDTLNEMHKDREKPGAELVIAYGIDPAINVLERRETKWEDEGEAEKDSLPTVDKLRLPDEEFLTDLEEKYPGTEDDFSDYVQANNVYKATWESLRETLEGQIRDDYEDLLEPLVDNDARREEQIEGFAQQFSENILELSGTISAHHEKWMKVRGDLRSLRNEHDDEFDDLEDKFETVKQLNQNLLSDFYQLRKEYKDEYGITDLEVEEAKNTTELEGPEIVDEDVTVI